MDRYLRELQRRGANDPSAVAAYVAAVRRVNYVGVDLDEYITFRANFHPVYRAIDELDIYYELAVPMLKLVDFLIDAAIPFRISNQPHAGSLREPEETGVFIHLRTRLPWYPLYLGADVLDVPLQSFGTHTLDELTLSRIQILGSNTYRLSHNSQQMEYELDGEAIEEIEHAREMILDPIPTGWMSAEDVQNSGEASITRILGRNYSYDDLEAHLRENHPPNASEFYNIFRHALDQYFILEESSLPPQAAQQLFNIESNRAINYYDESRQAYDNYSGDRQTYAWIFKGQLRNPKSAENINNYVVWLQFRSDVATDFIDLSMAPPWSPYLFETVAIPDIYYIAGVPGPTHYASNVLRTLLEGLNELLDQWRLFCGHVDPNEMYCEMCGEEVCLDCGQTGACHS